MHNLNFNDWKISTKLLSVSFVSIALMVSAIFFYFLPLIRTHIVSEKEASLRQMTEVVLTILEQYDAKNKSGELSVTQAKNLAKEEVKKLRYSGKEYFWINDYYPKMIMHPFKPELDGQDLSGNKDPDGKAIFIEFARICKESGSGTYAYKWPRQGSSKPVPKISYVNSFKEWDWVIGTGIYVDDLEATLAKIRNTIIAGTIALCVLVFIITLFVGRKISKPLNKMVDMVKDIAEGERDLTKRLEMDTKDELGELTKWFNVFLDKLHDIMFKMSTSIMQIATATQELAATANQLATGAEEQTSQTAQAATAMEEMSASVQEVAKNSISAAEKAKSAGTTAEQGSNIVNQTVSGMLRISDKVKELQNVIIGFSKNSEKIGNIVEVIDDVADQTNLLALNAAIEAARAGEQGRGFAVVSDEVRKLAERTTTSTKEIAGMVKNIQEDTSKAVISIEANVNEVGQGVTLANKSGESLSTILSATKTVQDMIQQIAAAAEEQSVAAKEISSTIESIAFVSKQNTTASKETSAATLDISRLTDELYQTVTKFKLKQSIELSKSKKK